MVTGPILVALVLLAIFVPLELARAEPLVDLRLYQRRHYTLSTLIAVFTSVALFGPSFLLPQYLQDVRGQTPFAAGFLLLWGGLGALGATVVCGWLYNRLGPPVLIVTGAVLLVTTGYVLAWWSTPSAALGLVPVDLGDPRDRDPPRDADRRDRRAPGHPRPDLADAQQRSTW